jgi:hypothetical protein
VNLHHLRAQLRRLQAAMPRRMPPVVFIFRKHDGSFCDPTGSEQLRAAREAGAKIITFRFMRPPSEATP